MAATRSHGMRLGRATGGAEVDAARACVSGPEVEGETGSLAVADPHLGGISDVSDLLARLLEERIPLALMADLINPRGPGSGQIMATEGLGVG